MRSKFLIAAAVGALMAGTTLASAQGQMSRQPEGGATAQPAPTEHHQAQPGKMQRGAQTPAQSREHGQAQTDDPNKARAQGELNRDEGQRGKARNADEGQRGKARNAETQRGKSQSDDPRKARAQGDLNRENRENGQSRQGQQNQGRQQEQSREHAQGQSGGSVTLTAEQRTRIRQTVLVQGNAPRVAHVDFSLTVGTVVPRDVKIVTVPETIVEIHPAWRGFLYFVVGEQIVIVDPGRHTIVEVISV